jgi:DnaK suppressor protein
MDVPSQLPKLIELSELPESYKPMVELASDYHPKKDSPDDYMNDRQLEYFRRKLVKWRMDLLAESMKTIENLREEARDVGDEAERASRETENSLELRARDRARKLINKIDNVLRLVEERRYGYCEETDEEIGIDRLDARPIATLCLDAQERREHQQKHIGEG